MSEKIPHCAKCQSKEVVSILYGLPTREAFKDASEGKLSLGGCIVTDQSPKWHCQGCEYEFGKLDSVE